MSTLLSCCLYLLLVEFNMTAMDEYMWFKPNRYQSETRGVYSATRGKEIDTSNTVFFFVKCPSPPSPGPTAPPHPGPTHPPHLFPCYIQLH